MSTSAIGTRLEKMSAWCNQKEYQCARMSELVRQNPDARALWRLGVILGILIGTLLGFSIATILR